MKSADKILPIGIALLLAAILALVAISINKSKNTDSTAKSVAQIQEVLFQSEKIQTLMLHNETGSRGYIITGSKSFLEPLQKSQKEIYDALASLRVLTTDNAVQQINIDSLSLYIDKRIAFSKRSIDVYDLNGANAATALVAQGEGKLYTDFIRLYINKIQAAENIELTESNQAREKAASLLNNILFTLIFVVLIFVIVLLIIFRIQLAEKNKSRLELVRLIRIKTIELNHVFERITDAFVALDTNWCFTYMNKKAGEILDRDPATMIGKNIWDELPEGIDQPFYKAYYAAMEQQQPLHVQEYYAPYDRWFENHIYPSADGLSIFFRDITEQKKYTNELELREERFRTLLENNPAIISLTDEALNYIYRSPSSTRITGWTDDDMKVTSGINRIHPDDIITMKATVVEATKNSGIPQPYLSRYLHKNGHYIWLEGTATKFKDESILKGIVFNCRDVTEKIDLENLLLKATRLAKIGSWNVDLIKQTVYWNDITREIHEAESSFVPDLTSGINFYREGHSRELISEKVKEAIELGKPWDEELEIVTLKNNVRWIRTIGETEFVDGTCVKIYGSFQDIDQRKKTEEKLIESLNRYRRLFDTSPIAITEEDHTAFYEKIESLRASGISKNYATYFDNHSEELYEMLERVHILGVNQSLLDLTGAHNLEDFVANRSRFFVSMTEMTVFKLMDLIRDGGGYFEEETKIKSLSGEIKEVVVRLKYPAAPPYNSVAITMRDVTKQKESEQKIKESEEKQKAILQTLLEQVVILDSEGQILYINHVAPGFTEEEVIGSNWLQWLHELDQAKAKEAVRQTLDGDVFSELQLRFFGTDRKMTWFNIRMIPMPDASNQQVLVVATDITEQKRSEEKIRLSEVRLHKAQEIGKFGYWQQEINSDVIWASKEAMGIYGFGTEEGELQRTTIAACIIDVDKVKEAYVNLLEHGKEYNIDIRINPADGSSMKFISTLAELEKNEKGVPVRIVGTLQDITERKKAEEKILFEQLDKMALINSTDDFIWSVSHDLKLIAANQAFINNIEAVAGVNLKVGDKILLEVFPQELLNQWQSYYKRALMGESFREESYSEDSTDKSSTWIETAFNPIYHNQDIIGIACFSRNITERKKTEEKIRLSEVRLHKAQEIGKFGYWQQELNSDVVWASKEAMRIYGFGTEEGELQKATIAACIVDVDKVKEAAINLLEHGKEYNIDIRINPADGSPMKYLSALAELEKNEKGQPVRMVGTLQDITERKKAEEELRLSENRTRKIFESDMIGFIYFDLNGEILDANDRFLEMTGYSTQDLKKNKINWSKMTPPEYKELDRIAIEEIVNTGICQPYEKEYFRKDGTRLAILIGATALEGSNYGKGVSYVLDITDRIKAEKKLKDNENYLRTILDTEPECVKILNSKGELVSMNPAGLAMIEADNEQQVLGHRMTELLVENHRIGFNKLSKEVFKGNSGTMEFEIIGLKGGHRWMETHAVPLKDTAGKVVNLLGVTRDITQRKKAEEKILNTTEELRLLTAHLQTVREEERKRIAREIHDELGQQLTAIKMDTVWIDKQVPSESVPIKNKLQNMIELLDGSHQSVRKILNELRPAALDENGLLETLEWLGTQFTETSSTPVQFTSNQTIIKLPQETAICIFRVYQEALTNIMRYAEASKVVSSLNIIEKSIVLTIEDDGKGFDTAAVQSKNSFGLLGMKERVHSLKGAFNLTSLPGIGTTIIVNLPYTNGLDE